MDTVTCYRGDKPYIFISYSHKDSGRVLPIIADLTERGFRCWFDEGIDPGTEWDETIAKNLNSCSYVMAFISANYLQSDNCKDELNYARDKNKPRLLVYLEDVELPEGMAMRLNRLQAVYFNRYKDRATALDKIAGAKEIGICRDVTEADPVQATTESSDAPLTEKKTSGNTKPELKKYLIPAAICLLLLIVVIILIVLFRDDEADDIVESTESSSSVVVESSDPSQSVVPVEIEPEADMVHVTLTAHEEMGVKDFMEAKEIIRGRVEILAGDGNYRMTEGTDTLDLWIPREAFRGMDVEVVLRCYLARAMWTVIFDEDSVNVMITREPKEYVGVDRSDIEDITLEWGTKDDFNWRKAPLEGEYPIFTITMTDEFVKRKGGIIAEYDRPLWGQDVKASSGFYFYEIMLEDNGKTIYLINKDVDDPVWAELTYYNLTHPALSQGFYYNIEVPFEWEDPANCEEPGKYQVAVSEMTGDRVCTFYTTDSDVKKGAWIDNIATAKKRLDAMEIPYAFGSVKDKTSIAVMLGKDELSDGMLRHLMDYWPNVSIYRGLSYYHISAKEYAYEEDDGTQILRGTISTYESEAANDFEENRKEPARVTVGYTYVPEAEYTLEGNEFVIRGPSRCRNMFRYVKAMLEYGTMETYFNYEGTQFVVDESGKTLSQSDLPFSGAERNNALADAIIDAIPRATVNAQDTEVKVYLHLTVDDTFLDKSFEQVRQIYEIVDMYNNQYDNLYIYLTDEDDKYLERARFMFSKHYNSLGDYATDGYIYSHGIFCNGKMEPYREAFIERLATDPFSKLFYEENHWTFELTQ